MWVGLAMHVGGASYAGMHVDVGGAGYAVGGGMHVGGAVPTTWLGT